MEIVISKPAITGKIDKRELQIEKMREKALQQAINRVQSANVPAVDLRNHVSGRTLVKYSLYAVSFITCFLSAYFNI